MDSGAKTFQTTRNGGPKWDEVRRRVTYDADTGKLIKDEPISKALTSQQLHRRLPGRPRHIKTELHYEPAIEASAPVEQGHDVRAVETPVPEAREYDEKAGILTVARLPSAAPGGTLPCVHGPLPRRVCKPGCPGWAMTSKT